MQDMLWNGPLRDAAEDYIDRLSDFVGDWLTAHELPTDVDVDQIGYGPMIIVMLHTLSQQAELVIAELHEIAGRTGG